MLKPFLVILLVVAFAVPGRGEPLRLEPSLRHNPFRPLPSAKRDSLVNGIVIGAIVGALWCGFVCAQGADDPDGVPLAILSGAGMGALVGGAIDAHYARQPGVIFRVRF